MRLMHFESRMPGNSGVSEMHGRDRNSDGTLWDQEQQETSIRLLVEEAKVNLCMRILSDYKKWWYSGAEKEGDIIKAMNTFDLREHLVTQNLSQFEDAYGLLMKRALDHVEALQLMDLPLLVEHIAFVLASRKKFDMMGDFPAPTETCQETVVMHYFASLMKHAESLNNGEVLAKSRELNLLDLAVKHVLLWSGEYSGELRFAVALGFAALAENEDFRSCWEPFFQDVEQKERFLELEEKLSNPIVQESPEAKRDLRPLLDFYNVIRRSM